MRPRVITLLLLFVSSIASAQEVAVRPRVNPGDEFHVELTRVRQDRGKPTVTSRTPITVQVISVGSDGAVWDWVPGPVQFADASDNSNPLVAAVVAATRGLHFRLALTADGEFIGIQNAGEVSAKLQGILNTLITVVEREVPQDRKAAVAPTLRQLLSPETMVATAAGDAQMYLALNGVELAAGERAQAPMSTAMPLGSGSIASVITITMDSVTPAVARLSTETAYDATALRAATTALVQQVAGRALSAEEEAKMPTLQMTDKGRFEFDRTFGLMREVVINRRIAADGLERTDEWTLRLVAPPRRQDVRVPGGAR